MISLIHRLRENKNGRKEESAEQSPLFLLKAQRQDWSLWEGEIWIGVLSPCAFYKGIRRR